MGGGASVSRDSPRPMRAPVSSYSSTDIEAITNCYHNILGKGGEGKVFAGVTTNTNTTVAVKLFKQDQLLTQDHSSEFDKEIQMLSDLDHPNVVTMLGYCNEHNRKIVVYEFMCNGTLDENLYRWAPDYISLSLSWKERLNICIGAGRGLRYLHTPTNKSPKGIIHRDVKPKNILLDENLNAKISDFGISKMGAEDQVDSEIVSGVKGTAGYMAPEYYNSGKMTRRIDVFAFGVVLSEVLNGKKPWKREEQEDTFCPTDNENYANWATENVAPDLEGTIAPRCLVAFTGILNECLKKDPKRRPSMDKVVSRLEFALECQEKWETEKSNPTKQSYFNPMMMGSRERYRPSGLDFQDRGHPHLDHFRQSMGSSMGSSMGPSMGIRGFQPNR